MGLPFVNTIHSLLLNLVDLLKISKSSALGEVLGDLEGPGVGHAPSGMNALQPPASRPPMPLNRALQQQPWPLQPRGRAQAG